MNIVEILHGRRNGTIINTVGDRRNDRRMIIIEKIIILKIIQSFGSPIVARSSHDRRRPFPLFYAVSNLYELFKKRTDLYFSSFLYFFPCSFLNGGNV